VSTGSTAEVVDEGPSLPRSQSGATPQHLIVTLFGDYWLGRREHLPSSALLALTGEFSVSETSARAALSRLTNRGLLVMSRVGRRTFYGACDEAQVQLQQAGERIFAFGARPAHPWDGEWTVVAFSVPEEQRHLRHTLRSRLRWLGFAALYDGLWVSPRPLGAEASDELEELGIKQATVFTAHTLFPDREQPGHPLLAWDLEDLRSSYERFLTDFAPMRERVLAGQVTASEALVARTAAMDTWRRFPGRDPELPGELLPSNWPREQAYAVFTDVYDGLGPLAELRFRQILGEHAPDLVPLVRHHTSAAADRPIGRR
jgi:phenylacetic acid degradation operon negative regulatory protein